MTRPRTLRLRGPTMSDRLPATTDPVAQPQERHFDVIVMAASTGGLTAISEVLGSLPAHFPAAVCVVLHRRPARPSLLAEILAGRTRMRVTVARTGQPILSGHVYVAPPDLHLVIGADEKIALMNGHRIKGVLSSADPMFASAAAVFRNRAIGVVLTGGDSDGSEGVRQIKAAGGVVLAQDRSTSQVFEMPSAAIATGQVDRVLPLREIAPALVRLVRTGELPDNGR